MLTIFGHWCKVGKYQVHYCLKCFDNKNVVVASSDAKIYSVVQGDIKTTDTTKNRKQVA
jgi:hypothetical protein